MPSEKQVAAWVEQALRRHMLPDVLGVRRVLSDDRSLVVTTRKTGTRDEPGDEFLVSVDLVPF